MTPISPVEAALALSQQVEKLKAQLVSVTDSLTNQMARAIDLEKALAAAQQQAAESAALAERMREQAKEACEFIDKTHIHLPGNLHKAAAMGMCASLAEACDLTPTAALAQYRDGVLEEVATATAMHGNPIATMIAAEIRAMKGKA